MGLRAGLNGVEKRKIPAPAGNQTLIPVLLSCNLVSILTELPLIEYTWSIQKETEFVK
jgi:hypothetical protein